MSTDPYLRQFERAACSWLAVLRWGPTGWCCPRCESREGTQLADRPRVIQCKGCPCQRSVTSGTVFAYTKLPIHILLPALREALFLRSCPFLEATFGIARSSAWHLQARALRVLDRVFDSVPEPDPQHQRHVVPLRATGKRGLHPNASPWFASAQRLGGRWAVQVRVDVVSEVVQVGHLGPGPTGDLARQVGEYEDPVRGLRRFLGGIIGGRRPSLRWGPRWIGAIITSHLPLYSEVPFEGWLARTRLLGHAPRRRMEPWQGTGPWAPATEGAG
jgi:hypothetical protein